MVYSSSIPCILDVRPSLHHPERNSPVFFPPIVPSVLSCPTYPLSLAPLILNSIFHRYLLLCSTSLGGRRKIIFLRFLFLPPASSFSVRSMRNVWWSFCICTVRRSLSLLARSTPAPTRIVPVRCLKDLSSSSIII